MSDLLCDIRLYDQQRLHFKNLEDTARDQYLANARAMATGASQTNCQLNSYKNDFDRTVKSQEQSDDQAKLNYVNASTLTATQNLQAGLTAKSFGV